MTLYTQLKAAKSEEDVKDAYIKALGLKGNIKGLIGIQTKEIWFEAKDTGKHSSYAMFNLEVKHSKPASPTPMCVPCVANTNSIGLTWVGIKCATH